MSPPSALDNSTQVSSRPEPSTLCNSCNFIELLDHDAPYAAGTPAYIAKKGEAGCELCAYYATLLAVEQRHHGQLVRESGYIKDSVEVGGYSHDDEESLFLAVDGTDAVEIAAFEEFPDTARPKSGVAPYIADGLSTRPALIDFEMVRAWLKGCDGTHAECNKEVDREDLEILLVDLSRQCIVRRSSMDRFVALSYVSGGKVGFRTVRSNCETVMQENALFNIQNQLPRVIRDAFEVAKALGERYIWVDSLCIVQDDEQNKHDQIAQMHLIYNQAYLTLASVSGQDAEEAIPGVTPGSRAPLPLTKTINYYRGPSVVLAAASPGLSDVLKTSSYETRGWTFQERVLSRRCLYFTRWEVFFQCAAGARSEMHDMGRDPSTWQQRIKKSEVKVPKNLLTELEQNLLSDEREASLDQASRIVQAYFFLVEGYTTRSLRHHSDILAAFAGIMGSIKKLTGCAFVHGLPEDFLDIALLWMPVLGRPTTVKPESGSSGADSELPSWSWTSHKGGVHYPKIFHPDRRRETKFESWFRTEVEWCHRTQEKENGNVPHSSTTRESVREANGIINHKASEVQGLASPLTYTLTFWATSIKASELQFDQSQAKLHATNIIDSRGKQCGLLLDDLEFIQESDISSCHVILLSKTRYKDYPNPGDGDILLGHEFYRPFPGNQWSEKISMFDYDYIHQNQDAVWAMNIMLARLEGDVFTRVATGFIHERAWADFKPDRRLVRLA